MKRILAAVVCLIISIGCLSSCSFGWNSGATITSASVIYDEQAKKYYIQLVYDDDETSIIEVGNMSALKGETGDSGEKGEIGNGISEILTENKGKYTQVTIKYTSEEMEDSVFEIPNGEYVSSVQLFPKDETHDAPYLVFTFSGETEPKEILLPVPKDGVGIKDITFTDEGKDISHAGTLVIKLTDDVEKKILIPAATGISGIEQSEEDGEYVLNIIYTDGNSDRFSFAKPNEWLSGSSAPSASDGKSGDFYFDTYKKVIYKKVGSQWEIVMEFDREKDMSVTFNAEDADIYYNNVSTPNEIKIVVKYGNYIDVLPIPKTDGKKFIGWYRKKQTEALPGEEYVLGCFTDLVPVTQNVTLYAWWE